ncbi:phage tail protein [Nocardia sp. NPDC049707]|uniref:phage tail protein n=1 Tax=Nocardia sp. NPDC049707 TaxID=3154735 RepID=UPI00342173C6
MAIGDTISGSTFVVDLGKFEVETVQQVCGLSFGMDTVEIKEVTRAGEVLVRRQAGSRRGGEITITRGVDRSQVFTDWIQKTMTKRDMDDVREDITLMVLGPDKKPVKRVHLSRAWASGWHRDALDAANGPVNEAVTIAYEDIVVEDA